MVRIAQLGALLPSLVLLAVSMACHSSHLLVYAKRAPPVRNALRLGCLPPRRAMPDITVGPQVRSRALRVWLVASAHLEAARLCSAVRVASVPQLAVLRRVLARIALAYKSAQLAAQPLWQTAHPVRTALPATPRLRSARYVSAVLSRLLSCLAA